MRTVGVLFLIIGSILTNDCCLASAAVDLSSDAGPEVCSGTTVTFTCRVSVATARWTYDGVNAIVGSGATDTTLGSFVMVAVIDAESNITFVTTTATVNVTSDLSGTNITCEEFPVISGVEVATLPDITGPPTFVPAVLTVSGITPVSGGQWEFMLRWEVPPEYCDLDYVFTPLQPIGLCTTTCTTECRGFRVGAGPRTFTVTAQNCGTQNGNESEPLQMYLERPDAPGNVSATATYDLDSNRVLSSFVLSWDEVIPNPSISVGNVPIQNYTISGVGADPIQVPPGGSCSNGGCSYEVDVPEDGSTEYNVSVAAMNRLGVGDATIVGPVFTSNVYADVTPVPEDGNCTLVIECSIEGVNEFWITVNQNGTAVLTRRLIDCNASAAMMVDELSMLPVELEYEIEMMIGDIMVMLLGTIEECTTPPPPIVTTASSSEDEGLSLGAIVGIIVGVIAGVLYCAGVAAAGGMAWYIRPAVSCLVIFLLIWLSWIYFIYLLCAGKKKHHSKGATQKSVETQMDDEVKSTEQVEMADTYETVPPGPPAAVKTKVMGVESTPPQQTAAKSEEEPKAAKKKGFFKNRSGKKAAKKESDEVELQPPEPLESAETGAETGALYQDPGEIKREEYPGTHDFYAQPDIKRKTHKPEDHLPTYGDPRDIKHVEAPETGELYAVTKQPSKKRAAPPPPEGATGYTSVDIEKKHRAKELNYSELQMPPGGPAPPSQHVEYSNVVQL